MTSKDAPKPGQKPVKNKTQARSAARLYAVQALFQMEQSDQSTNKVIVEFEDHRFGATYEGDEYAEGDTKLFAHQDGVEQAWRIVDPLLASDEPVLQYSPGGWGPPEADRIAPR